MADKGSVPSWEQYGFHAVAEMERLSGIVERMDARVEKMEQDRAEEAGQKKVVAALLGFAAAGIFEIGKFFIGLVKHQ